MLGLIILGIILLILHIVIVSNVKVVPQAHAYVIERLGTYHVTWSTGLHVKIPLSHWALFLCLKFLYTHFSCYKNG